MGPIADFAVADADEVGEAVAGEVGQVDGLFGIGKHEARTFFFVVGLADVFRRAEAVLGE